MTWKRMLLVTLMVGLGAWASACSSLFSKCGPSNCTGCCDATGTCQAAAADHCGVSGATCTACVGLQQCIAGACGFPGSGNNGGSGSGSGSSTSTSGSTGTTGTTGNCAALGATCTSNSQCCSGDCLSGHCYGTATSTGSSSTGSCQGYGGNCTSSGQCCSGLTCNSGSCTYSSTTGSTTGTTGGCLTYGRSCTSNSQCCSGLSCNGSYCTYTSGTTGTTGTTGSSGTTGSQCGTCQAGQSCQRFTSASGSGYYACACTQANGGIPDSCATNTNDKTACDQATLACRGPKTYEPCNSDGTCATGFFCISFQGPSGPQNLCGQACNTSTDCVEDFTHCVPGELNTADGGTMGMCDTNLCGPAVPLADGGTMAVGNYYQPCNAVGTGDGFCVALPANGGGNIGYCYYGGTAQTGASCSGVYGDKINSCVAGDICLGTGEAPPNYPATVCLPVCNANPDGGYPHNCPTTPTPMTCHPWSQTGSPQPGYCY